MKKSTAIVLAVVLVGGIVLFAMVRSTSIPSTGSYTPAQTTVGSIFGFATKALDATEKAFPKFFDSAPDPTESNLTAYASSAGFGKFAEGLDV